jgi:two-component system, NtrC family, response regulator HydG
VPGFDTRDPAFRQLLRIAERAARSQASVLLTGESGTGKNRLAAFLHEKSLRSAGPFVEVPCANLPAELLESDLFGHEKGAFTGAHEARTGRFERATGGTLYLDEIQELEPELQAKVLRAIDERCFERLGGNRTVEADVRVVASTREDPVRLVRAGRLREDLYYRLDVVRLKLPPLRDRRADIPVLAQALLDETVALHRLPPRRLAPGAIDILVRHAWPGNIRELRHAVEAAAILAEGETIGETDLPASLSLTSSTGLRSAASAEMSLEELERAYTDEVLRRTRGNKSAAARILGIHRKTLHERLRARRRPSPGTAGGGDDPPTEAGE